MISATAQLVWRHREKQHLFLLIWCFELLFFSKTFSISSFDLVFGFIWYPLTCCLIFYYGFVFQFKFSFLITSCWFLFYMLRVLLWFLFYSLVLLSWNEFVIMVLILQFVILKRLVWDWEFTRLALTELFCICVFLSFFFLK